MPPLFDRETVRERLQQLPGGPTQPLTVHLRQEIDRLNAVIALTTATLRNLRLAIAGATQPLTRTILHACGLGTSHPHCSREMQRVHVLHCLRMTMARPGVLCLFRSFARA